MTAPPTTKNIVIHNTTAASENNPGHIKFNGSVEINAKIIATSTVRSQKMSKIPPNVVGSLTLARAPSKLSKKNDYVIKIADIIINSKVHGKIPLNKIKIALNNPKINPIIVR